MKTIKLSILFFVVMFLSASSLNAQVVVEGTGVWLDRLRLDKTIKGIDDVSYSNIGGDPYLFKDFHQGKMILKTGETYPLDMRFDIYANAMHFKYKNELFVLTYPEKTTSIIIDTLRFFYSGYLKAPGGGSSGESSYFILKTDGKCKLLIKKNIRIQDAEPAKPFQDAKPVKFILTNDTYYLKLKDESAVRIRNEKDLLSFLGDQKASLSQFIKSNKFSVNNIEDLSRIVAFYNGL
jgi:hypothetical protein